MRRTSKRKRFIWALTLFFIAATSSIVYLFTKHQGWEQPRLVVVASDPVSIILLRPKGQKSVRLTIPKEARIEGSYGYGPYRLDALWKLGFLNRLGGDLLTKSLSNALGLPITYYIGTSTETLSDSPASLFSLRGLRAWLSGGLQTNMPFWEFFRYVRNQKRLDEADVTTINASDTRLLIKTALPDGSEALTVDPERVDTLIGSRFEDEDIRSEALRVMVINTTGIVGLGGKIARIISHTGSIVIAVTSEEQKIAGCRLSTSPGNRTTKTFQFLESYFGCDQETILESERADIVLRIGE